MTSPDLFTVAFAALLSVSSPEAHGQSPLTTEKVLENARKAAGVDPARKPPTRLKARGTGLLFGNRVPVTMEMDAAGHFTHHFEGPIPFGSGWNGNEAWLMDLHGQVRTLQLGERSEQIIWGAAITGYWLDPAAPFRYTLDAKQSSDQKIVLAFEHTGGFEKGTIELDPSTWLATRWSYSAGKTKQSITLEGTRESGGLRIPRRIIEETENGARTEFEWEQVTEVSPGEQSALAPPRVTTSDVQFDSKVASKLEVVRAPTGHLLVRPRINGQELGWYIFDTGAGSTVINTSSIEKLGLKPIGKVPAIGVGGAVESQFYRLDSIELGPVTLDRSIVVALDLDFLTIPFGRPIGGIVGFDFIARCVVELDLKESGIALHNPAGYQLLGAKWEKMQLVDRVPAIDASFEGKSGLFRLDTGAAGEDLTFHYHTVLSLKLAEGRNTKVGMSGGVGGMVLVRNGVIKGFEFGGNRWDEVSATFATESKGAFDDPYTAGVISGGFLSPFITTLDYENRRIAFRPRGG